MRLTIQSLADVFISHNTKAGMKNIDNKMYFLAEQIFIQSPELSISTLDSIYLGVLTADPTNESAAFFVDLKFTHINVKRFYRYSITYYDSPYYIAREIIV